MPGQTTALTRTVPLQPRQPRFGLVCPSLEGDLERLAAGPPTVRD